eukprot:387377-Alexandrium_andersonii.AAC.1
MTKHHVGAHGEADEVDALDEVEGASARVDDARHTATAAQPTKTAAAPPLLRPQRQLGQRTRHL